MLNCCEEWLLSWPVQRLKYYTCSQGDVSVLSPPQIKLETEIMSKESNPEYLAKVAQLSPEDTERLLSRMTGKLPRRLEKNKLTSEEALAIQLELEDEQLQEWREKMQSLRDKETGKTKVKAVEKEVVVSEAKPLKIKSKQKLETNDKSAPKAKSKAPTKADQDK
jgi:hypothetical protein